MRFERSKNTSKNIVFGSILRVYQIVMPFIIRTVMIYQLGVAYLGLNSLFASILQILNMAELGVGSAMVYSMYKPIATDDKKKICALMKLYRLYYRVIGIVILCAGVILIPFLPMLIKGDIPDGMNLYVLYGLNLGATVLTYWLFAYKNCIIIAHQRNDIVSKITLIVDSLKYVFQIIVLCTAHNYYCFLIVAILSQIITNIVTAICAQRLFPEYRSAGNLEKNEIQEINGKVKDLFTAKIGGTITASADTVVISAFLGLTVLAVYQNYYFVISSLMTLVAVIYESCAAGIGNSIVVESKEKNFQIFNAISFLILWITGWCTICLLCLFQPFMKIWVGDELLLDYKIVICICIYFFVYEIVKMFCMFKDAAGIWHEDRFRPLISSLVNLALNLLTVKRLGLYGVVLSTVISQLVISIPWLLHNLFTTMYEMKLSDYLKKIIKNIALLGIGAVPTFIICMLICNF